MIDKFNQQSFQRLRLNLRQLEVFLATARGGSTRAAADLIARSQSAASTSLAELEAALAHALAQGAPSVVKADGLAAGKGVVVAMKLAEAEQALRDMLGAAWRD